MLSRERPPERSPGFGSFFGAQSVVIHTERLCFVRAVIDCAVGLPEAGLAHLIGSDLGQLGLGCEYPVIVTRSKVPDALDSAVVAANSFIQFYTKPPLDKRSYRSWNHQIIGGLTCHPRQRNPPFR